MKKLIKSLVVIGCVLAPALASAAVKSDYSFNQTLDATTSFSLVGLTSDVSVGYNWTDLSYKYKANSSGGFTNVTADGTLGWTLSNGSTSLSGSIADLSTASTGSGTLSWTALSAGNYILSLSGNWVASKTNIYNPQNVTLPTIGFTSTASATNVVMAPVPEPESYAMFMAGLGMIGFIARRRRNV